MSNKKIKRSIKSLTGSAHPMRLPIMIAGICCMIVLVVAIIASKAPIASGQTSITAGKGPATHSCTSYCQSNVSHWVHLKSEAPADVIAAAKQTEMYQTSIQQANKITSNNVSPQGVDPSDRLFKQSTLGTPVLVKPYRDDIADPTYWIIPLLNNAKQTVMLLTFTYDTVNHQLQPSNFEGVADFTASHSFPSVAQATAIALIQKTIHTPIVLQGSKAPTLIYFESNPFVIPRAYIPGHPWKGGGTENTDPIWRIATSDGHYYYVDHLGLNVYTGSQLPVDPSYPPAL